MQIEKLKIRLKSVNGKLEITANKECDIQQYITILLPGYIDWYIEDFNLMKRKEELLEEIKYNFNELDFDITVTENLPTSKELLNFTSEEWFEKNRLNIFSFDCDDKGLLILDMKLRFYEIFGNENIKIITDEKFNKLKEKQVN